MWSARAGKAGRSAKAAALAAAPLRRLRRETEADGGGGVLMLARAHCWELVGGILKGRDAPVKPDTNAIVEACGSRHGW